MPLSKKASPVYWADFDGSSSAKLHGTTPDVGAGTWSAFQDTAMTAGGGFKADGSFDATSTDKGAFLPFTPVAGNVYSLEASLYVEPNGANTWAAIGFAGGVPSATDLETGSNRFLIGAGVGRAWMLIRTLPTTNQEFVGGGTMNGENWVAGPNNGGDFDIRILLDTTTPVYTATFYAKRPSDSGYTLVSSGARNVDPVASPIGSIGFADNFGAFSARVSRISLTTIPEPTSIALLGIAVALASSFGTCGARRSVSQRRKSGEVN
jgi:hypothetical protein